MQGKLLYLEMQWQCESLISRQHQDGLLLVFSWDTHHSSIISRSYGNRPGNLTFYYKRWHGLEYFCRWWLLIFFFLRKLDLETAWYNGSKQTLEICDLRSRNDDYWPVHHILQLFFDLSEQSCMSSNIIPSPSANKYNKGSYQRESLHFGCCHRFPLFARLLHTPRAPS